MAKEKDSRKKGKDSWQKEKTSRQKKKPHVKRKNLTAERKNLTAERKNRTAKRKSLFLFFGEFFPFAVTVVGHRAFLIQKNCLLYAHALVSSLEDAVLSQVIYRLTIGNLVSLLLDLRRKYC